MNNKQAKRLARKQKRSFRSEQRHGPNHTPSSQNAPPQWDPDLPRTVGEIEALMHDATLEMTKATAAGPSLLQTEYTTPGAERKIALTPTMFRSLKLQQQLFRAVFQREPTGRDPVFWDRDREQEGCFHFDADEMGFDLHHAAVTAKMRPEMTYAIGCTGRMVTEQNCHLLTKEARTEWETAVADYRQQSRAAHPPIPPPTYYQAYRYVCEVVAALGPDLPMDKRVDALRCTFASVLGSDALGVTATHRFLALLHTLQTRPQYEAARLSADIPIELLSAAATARVHDTRYEFVSESFDQKAVEFLALRGEPSDADEA